MLLLMMVADPVFLNKSRSLIMQPVTGEVHPLAHTLSLLCCRVSWNTLQVEEYQAGQQISSQHLGKRQPRDNMQELLENGHYFALEGITIPCVHL